MFKNLRIWLEPQNMGLILDKVLDIVTGLKCINDDFNYDPKSIDLVKEFATGIVQGNNHERTIVAEHKAESKGIQWHNRHREDEWLYKLAKESCYYRWGMG